jgi:hypothetical protein
MNEFALIAIDPGVTCGWAKFIMDKHAFSRPHNKILSNIKLWDCGEFTGSEQEVLGQAVTLIDRTCNEFGFLRMHVMSEDFDLVQTIGSKENLLSPVRQNAVLAWECQKRGIILRYQRRNERTSVTKKRLKLWGFEGGFKRNEFAAMQHGMKYLRSLKSQSKQRPWKLDTKDVIGGDGYDCACHENIHYQCDLIHP